MSAPQEAKKLHDLVAALAEFGGFALRTDDLDDLFQHATRLVSDAINVDLVKVLERQPDGQNLLVRAGVNWNPGVVGHATIPAGGGSAAGHALRSNQPVITEDVAAETRFSIPRLLIEHGVRSTVNVVIRGDNGPFGVLEVDSRRKRRFGQDDIDFLQNYANLLSAAIHRLNAQRELDKGAEKQQFLLHELQHRINNLLTTIRAIAHRTRATSSTLEQFAKSFDGRLAALARIHNLLNRPNRTAVTIQEIAVEELSAQGAVDGENLVCQGPNVALSQAQAEVLSMAFHELATNAVKHGALSVSDGSVEITWDSEAGLHADEIRIRWREHGVQIAKKPVGRGHGSDVLEKSIPRMLGGKFDRTFQPDGVDCLITFPLHPA